MNLQTFGGGRAALLRNTIADYMEVNGAYELMGTGFTSLDESPNAQTDNETYINEVTSSADITGYETEFPYESRLIPSQKAIYALYKIGRDHAVGDEAQMFYVRVDLFNPIGTPTDEKAEYTARRFKVANEVSDIEGEGGKKISLSGTLHAVGDPVQGKFDTVTKTFTEGDFKGKYDEPENPGGEQGDETKDPGGTESNPEITE